MFFPPQCILCRDPLDRENALCGSCWRKISFTDGMVCHCCGTPIMGDFDTGQADVCDDCLIDPPLGIGGAPPLFTRVKHEN
ncbi:MAG: double zinc ribbon domain-containing protein [Paracoccaceae bacterium]